MFAADGNAVTLGALSFVREADLTYKKIQLDLSPAITYGQTAQERGVDRSLVEVDEPLGDLFNPPGQTKAVERTENVQRFEDEQVKRAVRDVGAGLWHVACQQEPYLTPCGLSTWA